jgi:hypothetical protein
MFSLLFIVHPAGFVSEPPLRGAVSSAPRPAFSQ